MALGDDRNFDGQYTITDLWLNLKDLFFAPGDALVQVLIGSKIGRFFEFSSADLGGFFSGAFSTVVWLFAVLIGIGGIMSFNEWIEKQRRDYQRELRKDQRKTPE